MRTFRRVSQLSVLAACILSSGWSADVRRSECFPVEQAAPELREKFEVQLLAALDSEYLYTLIGGLKPITDGGGHAPVGLWYRYPDLRSLRELQSLSKIWTCGDSLYADVVVSWVDSPRLQDGGKRRATLLVVNRPAFGAVLDRKQNLFGPYGFTAASNPSVVYYAAWNAKNDQDRMLGYLYGFPDHAIEWYASVPSQLSGTPPASMREWFAQNTREITIPLYTPPIPGAYGYHYNVPKAAEAHAEDLKLQDRAAAILKEYRARRDKYIGAGKAGVVALIRDWYDDGTGHCSPANTMRAGPK